ncbi:MAG: NADH-quinone oxidoreductase subunit NuoH [Bdellovibrionales bacterium]|nr:NADH-quinone oxidoreductase subunit NuoH [Bdellovibrionales bacterium]
MGQDAFEITVNSIKLIIFFLFMVQLVPLLVWFERRGSAFIQNRLGPNRVGPLGLLQLLADAVKFVFKEQFVPERAVRILFFSAPVIALIPATLSLAAIPFSAPIPIEPFEMLGRTWGPYRFDVQSININVGIIYILGVSSLGAYSLLTAGWGSGNKYSLLGALRASAQMISYELALGLSIVGILMIYGTFNLTDMINMQAGPMTVSWMGSAHTVNALPNWGIFFQPLGALLFLTAAFAESNRLPFDLPEAEGELVAGFHTEYGGLKMNLFFIGEYGHMLVSSCLFCIFYLGGYAIPYVPYAEVLQWMQGVMPSANTAQVATAMLHLVVFLAKAFFFLWLFIWVRWTLPRFRYDHLMDFGWKTMLPWALGNTAVTAVVLYFAHS